MHGVIFSGRLRDGYTTGVIRDRRRSRMSWIFGQDEFEKIRWQVILTFSFVRSRAGSEDGRRLLRMTFSTGCATTPKERVQNWCTNVRIRAKPRRMRTHVPQGPHVVNDTLPHPSKKVSCPNFAWHTKSRYFGETFGTQGRPTETHVGALGWMHISRMLPVNQAAPLLSDTLGNLLERMRLRLLLASDAEAITIARDTALFALVFRTMRRGFDISHTLGSHILRLPDSAGLKANFQFGKTLRVSAKKAVVVMADGDSPTTCAFGAVTTYIEAAYRAGWNLASGHMFPQVSPVANCG